ncbi:hypothetical protein CYMTET_22917 [Cymbomonas tetramitiformis]|uniref:SHSP domain-containing protein n=1 Tax=Cymbomonas tetramitiformis TaxID=36881 RepID=A0AAE0FZ01_9CHLO|nr:hypothetical protein CYMTET_22917 [Cymbomonas tetramitiformis]
MQSPTEYTIEVDLPGLTTDDVNIEVHDDQGPVLVIDAEKEKEEKDEGEDKDIKWHRMERSTSSFHRTFRIPPKADEEKLAAKMSNGVLNITIEKKEKDVPKIATKKILIDKE